MHFVAGYPEGGAGTGADNERNTNSAPKCPPAIWV